MKILGDKIIEGVELESLTDEKFDAIISSHNIFAKISPNQKQLIISRLKKMGFVVGYIGDGVNDIGALKTADVGISVNEAVDVAKDTSDIILLNKDLSILTEGIIEGRRTFINTVKFIISTMSSSFGNVITISISSLFLKYIPFLPSQILLIDTVSDLQHLAISTDNVDTEQLSRPQSWNLKFFIKIMLVFGLISTLFDFLHIYIFLKLVNTPEAFRTLWLVESVITEILATFVIRTRKFSLKSRPSKNLILVSLLSIGLIFTIPFTKWGDTWFDLERISLINIGIILLIVLLYLMVLEFAKRLFYKIGKS